MSYFETKHYSITHKTYFPYFGIWHILEYVIFWNMEYFGIWSMKYFGICTIFENRIWHIFENCWSMNITNLENHVSKRNILSVTKHIFHILIYGIFRNILNHNCHIIFVKFENKINKTFVHIITKPYFILWNMEYFIT